MLDWEYSRNQRRHALFYNEVYDCFEIKSCTPFFNVQDKKLGYDVFFMGVKFGHKNTVKESKEIISDAIKLDKL